MIDFDETDLTPAEMQRFAKWFENKTHGHGHYITIKINDTLWSNKKPCECSIMVRGYTKDTEHIDYNADTWREAIAGAYLKSLQFIASVKERTIHDAALKLIEITAKEGPGVSVSKIRSGFRAKLIDENLDAIMARAEEIADSGPFVFAVENPNGGPVVDEETDKEIEERIPF